MRSAAVSGADYRQQQELEEEAIWEMRERERMDALDAAWEMSLGLDEPGNQMADAENVAGKD